MSNCPRHDEPWAPSAALSSSILFAGLGIVVNLWPVPVEVDHPIPFLEDRLHASYDSAHAHRFFRMLLQADRITKQFQGRFLGKTSPVHFFWAPSISNASVGGGASSTRPRSGGCSARRIRTRRSASGSGPEAVPYQSPRSTRTRTPNLRALLRARSGRRAPTIVANWATSSSRTKWCARHPHRMKWFWISIRAPTTQGPISLAG
jgi:hypothetical protein